MSGHFENGHFLSLAHPFARGMGAKFLTLPLRMTNPVRNGIREVKSMKPLDLTLLILNYLCIYEVRQKYTGVISYYPSPNSH